MRVTVLGKSPAYADAGGACSGYLVQQDGYTLLLDCGNGVFGKLREVVDFAAVDAVLISHLHADHLLDLVPFSYALRISPRAPLPAPALHAPARARETFRRIVGSWGGEDLIEGAFALREYAPDEELVLGPLRARFTLVPHYTQTHAVRLEGPDGASLTFGADHGPTHALDAFAHDSDLLILEATLVEPDDEEERGHLTPAEAGEHARRAAARRLLLTHYTDEVDAERARAAAVATFGGDVELARGGAVYTVERTNGG